MSKRLGLLRIPPAIGLGAGAPPDFGQHKHPSAGTAARTDPATLDALPIPPTKADATVKLRFKPTAEGGRQGPIVIGHIPYGCPLVVEGDAFDCRLLVSDQTLELGETYQLPVKFLNPDLALSRLSVGTSFSLWEGREIATGEVLRLA